MEIKRLGAQPSMKGPADWFTGTVRMDPLFQAPDPARVQGASVTFEPGARTAWHTHPLGQTLVAMPIILLGLALALDVFGAASGLGAQAQWGRIGAGVAFAVGAAATFGVVMVVTQHEIAAVDGRLRSAVTMGVVGLLAFAVTLAQGGLQWPQHAPGWWGLAMLTLLYGTAFTIMFTLLPRLGVVGSSPILNVEPVAAMVLAWALLGQRIAPVQVLGALIVVGTVMLLGLRRG